MKIFSFFFILVFFSCNSKGEKKPVSQKNERVEIENTDTLVKPIIVNNKYIRIQKRLYPLDKIDLYKDAIKKYSDTYNIDWLLIVSQILRESNFDKDAESHVGAKGLMQIMPRTEGDLKKDLEIEYIFERPAENIKAGIYHLSNQIKYFDYIPDEEDRLKIALAAYNCGPGRLIDAMKIVRYEGDDDHKWIFIREALRKLKKTDYELHLNVWPTGKPRHGYFFNSTEPILYVDAIWELYKKLKLISI